MYNEFDRHYFAILKISRDFYKPAKKAQHNTKIAQHKSGWAARFKCGREADREGCASVGVVLRRAERENWASR